MSATLRRVLLCRPDDAGWTDAAGRPGWQALGYREAPDAGAARAEHAALSRILESAGVEIQYLPADDRLDLDAVYTHDASLVTDHGAVLMRMGKSAREGEPGCHAGFYREHGIPVLGAIEAPGTLETGDIVWLDDQTLLVGRGYRSNAAGIAQLRALLAPHRIAVLEAPLPHGSGPAECLHLMSLMSVLDDRIAVVDQAWLSVPTVELLEQRRFELIPISPDERVTMAPNVLALGARRLVALRDNVRTNRRFEQHGFEVAMIDGRAIAHNGSGGPTCLTRPLLRR